MPGRNPLVYEGTRIEIRPGDCVRVWVNGWRVIGVVKTASIRSRRVEVWLPRAVVLRPQARKRSFRRVEVTRVPGRSGHWKTGPLPALRIGWADGPCRRAA